MKKLKSTKETIIKLPERSGILVFDLYTEADAFNDALNATKVLVFLEDYENNVLRKYTKYGLPEEFDHECCHKLMMHIKEKYYNLKGDIGE